MNKKGISLVFLPFLLFLILAFRYTGFANELFEQIAHDIEDIPELDSTAHRSHLEVPLDKSRDESSKYPIMDAEIKALQQFNLASFYYSGEGVERDFEAAAKLYKSSPG